MQRISLWSVLHNEKIERSRANYTYEQGYKHYIHRNIPPAFAFGHGLSYVRTDFELFMIFA